MSQGVIILIVMIVFFAAMYIYAVTFSNIEEKREYKKRFGHIEESNLKFKKLKEEHKGIRDLIDEKYRQTAERSDAIKAELKRVKQFKDGLDNRLV